MAKNFEKEPCTNAVESSLPGGKKDASVPPSSTEITKRDPGTGSFYATVTSSYGEKHEVRVSSLSAIMAKFM